MPRKMGDNGGGIRAIEDLRQRCWVNPDTRCWEWRGSAPLRRGTAQPRVWMADARRTESLPRAAWLLSGKPVPEGSWSAWRTCRCTTCGNPWHLMAGTKAEWGQWLKGEGYLRGRPERRVMNRRVRIESGSTVLTAELAAWARESQQTGLEVARVMAVSESAISRVRRGQTWGALTPVASIFALGASMNTASYRKSA